MHLNFCSCGFSECVRQCLTLWYLLLMFMELLLTNEGTPSLPLISSSSPRPPPPVSRGWGCGAARCSGCASAPPSGPGSSGNRSSDGGRRPASVRSDTPHLHTEGGVLVSGNTRLQFHRTAEYVLQPVGEGYQLHFINKIKKYYYF